MNLSDVITKEMVLSELESREKKPVIQELINHLVVKKKVSPDVAKKIERAVNKRESQGTTGIGKGLAIPHVKNCAHVSEILAVFGRSTPGVPFEAIDGEPVHLIFLVVSPLGAEAEHISVMKKIAALGRDEKTNRYLTTTPKFDNVAEIFKEVDGIE